MSSGQPLGTPLRHYHGVNVVAFSPDSRSILTTSEDSVARVWGVSPADRRFRLQQTGIT